MKFTSEKHLCDAFRESVAASGDYVTHPETFGFDLVLVDEDDEERIGVEAKLNDNLAALNQCVRKRGQGNVDAVAVLVVYAGQSFRETCMGMGVGVIMPTAGPTKDGDYEFTVSMPEMAITRHAKSKPLPKHASARPAGVPSPKSLTPTREKELRLCGIIERRGGFATAKDVQSCGLVRRFWSPNWIRFTGGVYKPIPGVLRPDQDPDFADVAAKYAAEIA